MPEHQLCGDHRAALDEYERLREHGARFFVLPGHEDPAVEDIVEITEQYVVVEKIGVASAVAESTSPRRIGAHSDD